VSIEREQHIENPKQNSTWAYIPAKFSTVGLRIPMGTSHDKIKPWKISWKKIVQSSITQPRISRFCWNLLRGCKLSMQGPQNCENPLPVKSKMADGA